MEEADGFDRPLADDPLPNFKSHNRSVLRPYGVWAVIAPFNFPFALAGGPLGPALIAGNTAVVKCSPQTSLSGLAAAGMPAGCGLAAGRDQLRDGRRHNGPRAGTAPRCGGHHLHRLARGGHAGAARQCRRPLPQALHLTEMGGKNATIVSRHGDVERAALGILRSAFGLSGQKCSARSRVRVERPLAACAARAAGATDARHRGGRPDAAGPLDGAGHRPRRLRPLCAAGRAFAAGRADRHRRRVADRRRSRARLFRRAHRGAGAAGRPRVGRRTLPAPWCWWARSIQWRKASDAPTPATTG